MNIKEVFKSKRTGSTFYKLDGYFILISVGIKLKNIIGRMIRFITEFT
jgi:hypothetical protein